MSEPLSAVEIEDVLSSIRRLVSEDLRPAARGISDPAPDTAKPALILTPALRVVPDAEPAREVRPAMPIQDVVASVSAAVESQGQDWESETGDTGMAAEPVWADAAWDMPVDLDASVEALPELAVEDVLAEAGTPLSAGWAQDGVEDIVEAEVLVEDGAAAFNGVAPDVAMTASIGPSADAEWIAQAEADVIAGLEQTAAEDRFEFSQPEAELSFDEEVLRDLVRDLIREELQGHLGERITRNIRKLVRAEIARALAVQDLV